MRYKGRPRGYTESHTEQVLMPLATHDTSLLRRIDEYFSSPGCCEQRRTRKHSLFSRSSEQRKADKAMPRTVNALFTSVRIVLIAFKPSPPVTYFCKLVMAFAIATCSDKQNTEDSRIEESSLVIHSIQVRNVDVRACLARTSVGSSAPGADAAAAAGLALAAAGLEAAAATAAGAGAATAGAGTPVRLAFLQTKFTQTRTSSPEVEILA
jgi:hypothetical protein